MHLFINTTFQPTHSHMNVYKIIWLTYSKEPTLVYSPRSSKTMTVITILISTAPNSNNNNNSGYL